ncbi:MAG TPA: protein phosphatase 2C domain-containing protein [Acidobacteriota bacterium]|nr:protein phosphatase 2C domain-containing protein [Acidobacteriota bacterium]
MSLLPKLQVVGKTDTGLVRAGNEDYLHLDSANNVYAVCDGMGGHQAGEVASMTASVTIERAFRKFQKPLLQDEALKLDRTLPAGGDLLLKSIRLANRSIFSRSVADPGLSGMGTTIVAVAFEADVMSVAHVGDSRAYRLTDRALEPLTRDHSWLVEMQKSQEMSQEEASSLVAKNVITRALGVRDTVEVDYRLVKVQPGEVFILCSDGLCGFADDDEIFETADKARKDGLRRIADDLVQMANDRGGSDNVTVVVIKVEEIKESPIPEVEVFTLGTESPEVLQAEDIWVAKLREAENENEDETDVGGKTRGRKSLARWLFGIFAIIVVVASLILYFVWAG